MADRFTVQNAAIILSCFHHDCKISQLEGTVINIKTIDVVLQNALRRLTLSITGCFINLHQHIKSVHQNMAAAHAGVNDFDVFGFDGLIFLADLLQLCLYIGFLLCFIQIVFPPRFQLRVRMAFQPQTAKTVLHHVANDPVRGKQLGSCRNALLGDFYILFQQGKGFILRLSVVILVQPADDLHLTGRLAVFTNLADIEVILRDVMHQMVHHAVLIRYRNVQQQFRVIRCCFKQHRQHFV